MKVTSTNLHSNNRLKFLIFGPPGVGKTTLASTLKEKCLVISAEAGLLSLSQFDIDVIDISQDDDGKVIPKEKRFAKMGSVYHYLLKPETQKKYQWVFVDSLTEVGQNLIEQLEIEYPEKKDALPMWGEYSKRMRSMIKTFRDLPDYNVVFTALDKTDKDDNGRRYTAIDLQGSIANKLPAFFDEVFWMTVKEKDGEARRVLLTSSLENVVSKDRSGMLEQFEAPDLGMIASKIRQKSKSKEKGK